MASYFVRIMASNAPFVFTKGVVHNLNKLAI
jgi:hypothetical protein